MRLAINGGNPIRQRPWPRWPIVTEDTKRLLNDVLEGTSWTISSQSLTPPRFDRELRHRWSEYIGVRFALPCASGTAALTIALAAMGIGPGDEVIVPGMTWVACPKTVYNLGATPILVDIDPDTLCISPVASKAMITDKTRAIMVVHAYCSLADLDAFTSLSEETGIPILEDCSQAHGSMWRDRRVGGYGLISVFSTQQSKLLTSGEGGLCCTDNEDLFIKMQQLRTDGRIYTEDINPNNWMWLRSVVSVPGFNYNLSEFNSALILDGLSRLEAQNDVRSVNLTHLEQLFHEVDGVEIIVPLEQVTKRAVWRLVFRIDPASFGGLDIATIGQAVTAELGLPVEPLDLPFTHNPLYQPMRDPRISRSPDAERFNPARFNLPRALEQHSSCLGAPHFCLLADRVDMHDIVAAFDKVSKYCTELL